MCRPITPIRESVADTRSVAPPQRTAVIDASGPRLTADHFSTVQIQFTLFTPDEEVSSAKILRSLVPKWQAYFDAEPFILPLSEGVPRGIPKVVLRTRTGDARCEIASERINFFWVRAGEASRFTDREREAALQRLFEYRDLIDARIGRLALVKTSFASHPNPGLFLARHFCDERWLREPLNRPENFELHAHKSYSLSKEIKVNSWVRSKTAVAPNGPGVLVEQDLNTLVEEIKAREFSAAAIDEFFEVALREMDQILALYYPRGGA